MLMFNADELFERLGLTVRCEDCMHRNKSLGDVRCENNTWSEVCDVLDHMKLIDAVPVVRCKDCRWFGKIGCAIEVVDETDMPKENDFCIFAEREDNETDRR